MNRSIPKSDIQHQTSKISSGLYLHVPFCLRKCAYCDFASRPIAPARVIEWTCEANPGTLTPAKARALRAAGVNRLSLGAQSFDDARLARLGRIHTAAEIRDAVAGARGAGFENLSLDLMYALPGETRADWERDLEAALALAPEHLSLYALTIEEGTPFACERDAGRLAEAD